MPIGAHRIRVSVTDLGGTRYVGGPASVTLLASDAGAQKRLTPLALHPEGKGPADTALVTLRFAVAGLAPGLRLADLQVVGLPQSVPFQSDGAAQADVPEGRWTVSIGLPPGAGSLIPPPPVTFVAVAGQEIDLGTLYAVSDAAALIVRYACHTDADCAPAPGRCDPQSRTCLDWTPPSVGPTVAACVLDTAACLADTGLGTQNPSTQAYPLTCAATPAGNVDLACGGCCVDAGGALACAEPGYGGCAPAAVAAAVPVNGACRPDRWCWVNPQPAGNGLNALWGDRTGQLFAVGSGGTILHFDGARWTLEDSGTGSTLLAVWGSSASDVWAAGSWESGVGTVLLHRTGGRWTNANPAGGNIELRGLWGAGPADVWAVGSGGMIYHHDGAAWSQVTSPVASTTTVLSSVWGSSSTDVWAVGDGAVVLHWDGVAWNRADTVANGSLVTGTGPKNA
jgi:hypothetical protein